LNKTKIHEALHYVHFWYKQIGTKEAARQAIQVTGIDDREAGILFDALNFSIEDSVDVLSKVTRIPTRGIK
jgi:hypothetical protein